MVQLKICELPTDDRPREKLAKAGPSALKDAELITVLLQSGIAGRHVTDVADELLSRAGSLAALTRFGVDDFKNVPGIGFAKAVKLVAAFALGKRIAEQTLSAEKLDRPEAIYALLGPEMRALRQESLRVLLLDTRYRLIRIEEVSRGSTNESIAHPRELFRPALVASAYAVIVVHNHPSGDSSPSQTDHSLTRRLAEAADILQIKLLDHIIIGAPTANSPGYFSFKEAGVL